MGSGRIQRQRSELRTAARCAFPHTLPILAGFLFLGMTYGIYMNVSGFSFWYPMFMSMTIFTGSVEFVAVNLLLGAFDPLQALLMTLMLNARHLFYGISMLDKYRGTGFKKVFLIFGMCDESLCSGYSKGCGQGMVYVFCHSVQLSVLGSGSVSWRNVRFSDSF